MTDWHWHERFREPDGETPPDVDTTDRRTSRIYGPNGEVARVVDMDPRPRVGFARSERGHRS